MNSRQLHIAAVAAADRFLSARRWRTLHVEQVFALELAGRPAIAGCVLGSTGPDHGLSLVLGERAIEELLAVCDHRLDASEVAGKVLWFTLRRRQDIDAPFDRALQSAEGEGRTAPLFLAEQAGGDSRPPRREEFEILLTAMRALEILAEQGRLDFEHPLRSGLVTTLVVRGAREQIEVERVERTAPAAVRPAAAATSRSPAAPFLQFADASTPSERAHATNRPARLAVAIPEVPLRNVSEEVRALILVDIDTGSVVIMEILVGDPLPTARDRLLGTFAAVARDPPSRPPTVVLVCDRVLEAMVGPQLRAAGIDCRFDPEVPEMERVLDALADQLLGPDSADQADGPFEVEGLEDLDEWIADDHDVTMPRNERSGRIRPPDRPT